MTVLLWAERTDKYQMDLTTVIQNEIQLQHGWKTVEKFKETGSKVGEPRSVFPTPRQKYPKASW
jgi:hypothetical protein